MNGKKPIIMLKRIREMICLDFDLLLKAYTLLVFTFFIVIFSLIILLILLVNNSCTACESLIFFFFYFLSNIKFNNYDNNYYDFILFIKLYILLF